MPTARRTRSSRSAHRGGRMRGRGAALDWFKRAGEWIKSNIKDTKLVSRVSGALAKVGVPYAAQVNQVSSDIGWGRRRGRGLRLAGSGRRGGYRKY